MEHPVIVTGGASGVGAETVRQLQSRGHTVICLDINAPVDSNLEFHRCDLSDPASIEAVAAKLTGTYSALLNIAGVPGGLDAELAMKVNFFGLRLLTEKLWDRIADNGSVVNVASIAGNNWRKRRGAISELLATKGFDDGMAWWAANGDKVGTDAYTLSKEAVVVYTMALAGEGLARNISVNDVGPGPVETPILADFARDAGEDNMKAMIDMVGRPASPSDIAEALVVLAERQISWLNGHHLVVDGGMVAGHSAGWGVSR